RIPMGTGEGFLTMPERTSMTVPSPPATRTRSKFVAFFANSRASLAPSVEAILKFRFACVSTSPIVVRVFFASPCPAAGLTITRNRDGESADMMFDSGESRLKVIEFHEGRSVGSDHGLDRCGILEPTPGDGANDDGVERHFARSNSSEGASEANRSGRFGVNAFFSGEAALQLENKIVGNEVTVSP